jgi:hypothetical protein
MQVVIPRRRFRLGSAVLALRAGIFVLGLSN